MARALATLALLVLATGAHAKEIIRCTRPKAADVVMTFGAERLLEREVNCIYGEFATDLASCAPDGAFGLTAPTGETELIEIVNRPQDYATHDGGVTGHTITQEEISFSGGFMGSYSGFELYWTFTANRRTGEGKLKIEKSLPRRGGEGEFTYACAKATQRF
jgi:hypothetical protein